MTTFSALLVWYPLLFVLLGVIAGLVMKVSVGRAVSLMVIGFFLSNLAMFILLSGVTEHISVLSGISFSEVVSEMLVPSMYTYLYILLLLIGYLVTCLVKRGMRSRGARR
jgi:hypothetical protein